VSGALTLIEAAVPPVVHKKPNVPVQSGQLAVRVIDVTAQVSVIVLGNCVMVALHCPFISKEAKSEKKKKASKYLFIGMYI